MTDWRFPEADGQTPLAEEEKAGLKLSYVMDVDELNAAEQANIVRARRAKTDATTDEMLDDLWMRTLHRQMFGEVWEWAGRYRTTERNIGFAPQGIAMAMRNLVEDARAWIAAGDAPDHVAIRVHHRLTLIHPFPNGNGRHAREVADRLAVSLDRPPFTWGSALMRGDRRSAYLAALRSADRGEIEPLLEFART